MPSSRVGKSFLFQLFPLIISLFLACQNLQLPTMASALLPAILQQLAVNVDQEMQQQVRLVRGVKKEAEKLSRTLRNIESVVNDAEKRQLMDEAIKNWVDKLKEISYDMDDVIDEWSIEILRATIPAAEDISLQKKVCLSFHKLSTCFCISRVVLCREIAIKIKKLNERLNVIAMEKDRYEFHTIRVDEGPERQRSTSVVDVSEICGREEDKDHLVGCLMRETSPGRKGLHVTCLVGMGGIGKTTLAQLAFNDELVKASFEIRIWVCVSDPFDETRIAKAIIENIERKAPNIMELETLAQHLRSLIKGKKFFLVLDDVWTEDDRKWGPLRDVLKFGSSGSRILVTTRNNRVATMMQSTWTLPLGKLSEEDCWLLFSRIAFSGREQEECAQLEDIGREIANKCNGLPLAAKTLGGLMRLKNNREEWQDILESEIWNLQEAERGLFPPLLLSYYDLPIPVRRCFSYCAVFPKDHKIVKDELVKLWMAQDFLSSRGSSDMEVIGRQYFENLATRCFFQDFEKVDGSIKRCKMHDIVHDFAQFLTKKECMILEVNDHGGLRRYPDFRRARHSTMVVAATVPFPTSICHAGKLRTLSIRHEDNNEIANAFPELCRRLTCLRALNLRNSVIAEVPEEVGRLVHLRFLNLCNTGLKELPEAVCNLLNLQTLNLTGCQCLQKLPQNIGKLTKLRHLEIDGTLSLRVLPRGIGGLTSLQTLSRFLVSFGDRSEACKIEDLENLNSLRKEVCVEGLGNVADAKDAEKAKLSEKRRLHSLELQFAGPRVEGRIDEAVLQALQPHSGIEHISISRYNGRAIFPSWMMSLSRLRKLVLQHCGNCKFLPPLGKLPSLESLGLFCMDGVEKVDLEFLGLETENGGIGPAPLTIFRNLKELTFCDMGSWEMWDGRIKRREGVDIRIAPCLRYLHITGCSRLRALPHYLRTTQPEELVINRCPLLHQYVLDRTGENWDQISHVRNIKIGDCYVQKDNRWVAKDDAI